MRTQLLKTHIKEGLVRAPSLLGMIDKHDPETTCVQVGLNIWLMNRDNIKDLAKQGRWSLRCCLPESEDVKSLKDASLTQQVISFFTFHFAGYRERVGSFFCSFCLVHF